MTILTRPPPGTDIALTRYFDDLSDEVGSQLDAKTPLLAPFGTLSRLALTQLVRRQVADPNMEWPYELVGRPLVPLVGAADGFVPSETEYYPGAIGPGDIYVTAEPWYPFTEILVEGGRVGPFGTVVVASLPITVTGRTSGEYEGEVVYTIQAA